MIRRPPRPTRTDTLFPYTPRVRSVVLPDGTLFGEGIKTRIKEKLMTECNLHTIVRLPNGVFNPYTGIKTNLLFFEKCHKDGKGNAPNPTSEVWFYEHPYPEGYKSYSKTKRSEEHTSELQSLMRISYAVFCLKKKTNQKHKQQT